jgi:hypothetical protein
MARRKITTHKKVVFKSLEVPESMRWLLERAQEAHCDEKNAWYFLRTLKWILSVFGYHDAPLYFRKQTPLWSRGYMWEVHVVLYEKPMTDGIRCIHVIHHASAPRDTFNAGIWDAVREVLMTLRNETAQTLRGSKFCHFPSKALRSSEVHVHSNVHDDPTGHLKEHVHLTKVMDHALAEAIQEIEDLHKCYEEQEQVIKDRDDLIAELLDEDEGSDDNSDHDSDDEGNRDGNNEGNGDGNDGGDDNIEEVSEHEPILEVEEDPQEVPQAVPAPSVFPQPNLYEQLMQDIAENPPARVESQGSSLSAHE